MRKSKRLSILMLAMLLGCLTMFLSGAPVAFALDSGRDMSQVEPPPERVTRIRTGGVRFNVFRIVRLAAYQELAPANDTFLVITGSLEASELRCVYADDFRVAIGDAEYTPVVPVMDRMQPAMRGRSYPAEPLSAQCIQGELEIPIYLVFDVTLNETPANLRFFDREGFIGDLNLLEVADDSEEGMLRYILGEPHRLRRNSNVRACAGTTCEILHVFRRDDTTIKIAETFGMEVRGSQLWYEVLLDDGRKGFVHSSLMRRINP